MHSAPHRFTNSPMEQVCFQGHKIYIKRDDLLAVDEVNKFGDGLTLAFAGNKARKLHYYLNNDFPDIDRIISYGSAQSNMLFSLSVLCKLKGWQLDFYVDHIASELKENPRGNYAWALQHSAHIQAVGDRFKESGVKSTQDYVEKHILPESKNALYIPEGGRNYQAEFGLRLLAEEIKNWASDKRINNPKLMLPSGTGTTAFFLQKHLPFEVLTCACVGGSGYLQQQFAALHDCSDQHPTTLETDKKYHFGKVYPEFFEIWQQLSEQTGIVFDLLYDPLGWICLLEYLNKLDETITPIYLHQGGLLGNQSMLLRYQRRFPGYS